MLGQLDVEKQPLYKILLRTSCLEILKRYFGYRKLSFLEKERQILKECFVNQHVQFNYPINRKDFDYLLEMGKRNKATYIENDLGEKRLLDKVIVTDDVSGLADKSDDFANFLTASRKCGITCIYIFHTTYCNRQNWQMVMSQTEIFIFFPGSVHAGSVAKMPSNFDNRYKNTFIPNRNI